MEWDRAAEELTWERLLGLDGSLVFLEHVFWVVSLNTLFVLGGNSKEKKIGLKNCRVCSGHGPDLSRGSQIVTGSKILTVVMTMVNKAFK